MNKEILLGNGAIARGIIENGCSVVYSYPGTPSSEILPEVSRYKKLLDLGTYIEWSVNEKVAFDNAFAASITGKRSAVIMKQVGLNVASDSLMSSAYTGVKGGMIIVSCDDPGPHSSQTEQDSRFFAMFAKVPVLDPSTPQEAKDMTEIAFEISEKYGIPVILRSTTRICHAVQNIIINDIKTCERKSDFHKEPSRWAATPKFRYILHKELNDKLKKMSDEFSSRKDINYSSIDIDNSHFDSGIISSGVSYAIIMDLLYELNLHKSIPVLKLGVPYPWPDKLVNYFTARCDNVLVVEDTDRVIEIQIDERKKVLGRGKGHVPEEGELTPEIVFSCIKNILPSNSSILKEDIHKEFDDLIKSMKLPERKPTLCPGCPHRAAFFAIKKSFPKAIFPSDIGCYTLGINLKAVDTVLDMGASVTMASGFYQTYHQDGSLQMIISTIGDSTFFHSGLPALINAVYNRARFILVILDNSITAMTGMQPTAGTGILPDGTRGNSISITDLVKACGIEYIKEIDPYDVSLFISTLKDGGEYVLSENGGIAVLISKHNCMLACKKKLKRRVEIKEKCTGCRYCINAFECPAIQYNSEIRKVEINRIICSDCGVCADVNICPHGAIMEVN